MAGILDEFLHLGHGFARHDDSRHANRAIGGGNFDPSEPVPVGRDGAQHHMAFDIGRVQKNAIEVIARLFIGNRELGFVDQPLEVAGGEVESVTEFARGEVREIAVRQSLQVEPRTPGAQLQPAGIAIRFERNLRAVRQLADNLIEGMRGDRGRAGGADVRRQSLDDFQVEIGRLQEQAHVFGAQ